MAIVALLDRRLEQVEVLAGHVGEDFREALDRLTAADRGARSDPRRPGARDALPLLRPAADRGRRRRDLPRGRSPPGGARRRPRGRRSSGQDRRARRLPAPAGPAAERAPAGSPAAAAPRSARDDDAALLPDARIGGVRGARARGGSFLTATDAHGGRRRRVATAYVDLDDLPAAAAALAGYRRPRCLTARSWWPTSTPSTTASRPPRTSWRSGWPRRSPAPGWRGASSGW